MSSTRVLSLGVLAVSFLGVLEAAFPLTAHAAWVNSDGAFQVGGELTTIVPTHLPAAPPGSDGASFANPTCSQESTSLALVSGSKLAGVDPVLHPAVLVMSCLGGSDADQKRLNFVTPTLFSPPIGPFGNVVKQIPTTNVPSGGWAYLVNRPDKGDLLGCGSNGVLYSIDYSRTTLVADGTATLLASSPAAVTSCRGLAWDADADVIYVGRSVTVGEVTTNDIVRFSDGATTLLGPTLTDPCALNAATKGLAISGGVLLVSCEGDPTIHRIDKNTGDALGVHGSLTATDLPDLDGEPGLSSLTCDAVTFTKDATTGKDLFTDALWTRRGGSVSALEFPAYTCGMPANSVVLGFSPLAAGLGDTTSGQPGAVPRAGCFDASGQVIDDDNDGLPDCWEESASGIDFDGDGTIDLLNRVSPPSGLCVPVDTNGDGDTVDANEIECASPTQKDLFVEIDYMEQHKPDPKALSQTQRPATLVNNVFVGVKSVREAFAAAPVGLLPGPPTTPPNNTNPRTGIKLHMHVDEQVSHVDLVAFTPCTPPASSVINSPLTVVDFDTIKAGNFGTVTERGSLTPANIKTLNAKRLAFRYALFAHNLVGPPTATVPFVSKSSGCAETGGDDAVVTMGSFTKVPSVTGHEKGTADEQAGTFMHELGHTLGFDHGGGDSINCKPNYRSVMNYARQFAGSPMTNRRLDFSRSEDPVLADQAKTGVLRENAGLDESVGLGNDLSLGPISPFFPSADQIAFGPTSWAQVLPATAKPINWNKQTGTQTNASGDLNKGPANSSCNVATPGQDLFGHDDWGNVLYRASAAINFAGGQDDPEMTPDDRDAFYAAADADQNDVGDNVDCGGLVDHDHGTPGFPCTHRLAVLDAIAQPANFRIVIFSEKNGSNQWNAPTQVIHNAKNGTATCPPLHLPANGTTDCTLTITVGDVTIPVKTPSNGTCSAQNISDPTATPPNDQIKDMVCQVKTSDVRPLPNGTVRVTVSGFFKDNITGETRAFSARTEVTIP